MARLLPTNKETEQALTLAPLPSTSSRQRLYFICSKRKTRHKYNLACIYSSEEKSVSRSNQPQSAIEVPPTSQWKCDFMQSAHVGDTITFQGNAFTSRVMDWFCKGQLGDPLKSTQIFYAFKERQSSKLVVMWAKGSNLLPGIPR